MTHEELEDQCQAYTDRLLRDSNEYLACNSLQRKRLVQRDLYDMEQAFEDGAKWAEKRTIDKAINFLKENLFKMESYCGDEGVGTTGFSSVEDFVDHFKQYINN